MARRELYRLGLPAPRPPASGRRLRLRAALVSPEYPDARLSTRYVIVFIATGLLTLLALAVFLAVAIPVTVRKRQRDAGYRAYCATRGYKYTASRPGAEDAYASVVSFFNEGVFRFWRCEISGTINGSPFVVFEYAYKDQGRAPLFVHAIMKWEQPQKELPVFLLLPASVFYETAGSHPAPRIEFPDDPFFTETCARLAPDPDAVRTVLSPDVHSALRTWRAADPGQYVLRGGKGLCWYQVGYLTGPDLADDTIIVCGEVQAGLLG